METICLECHILFAGINEEKIFQNVVCWKSYARVLSVKYVSSKIFSYYFIAVEMLVTMRNLASSQVGQYKLHMIILVSEAEIDIHLKCYFTRQKCLQMGRIVGKRTFGSCTDMCAQRRLRSACTFVQSDQSLRCPLEDILYHWLSNMRTVKILIKLRECACWSESSFATHVRRYVFSQCGLNV